MKIVHEHSTGQASSGRLRPARRGLPALFGLLLMAASSAAFADTATVQGFILYDKITADPQKGLLISSPVQRRAAGILVEVVKATAAGAAGAGKLLGRAFTDADGNYKIDVSLSAAATVYLRVRAQNENAVVEDANDGFEFAAFLSPFSLTPGTPVTKNARLPDSGRLSGPFNILDDIRQANLLLRSVLPDIKLPKVTVRWAADYDGGTFALPEQRLLFIDGSRSSNSDEFDDFFVIHEYGHHIANNFSRDDSLGGDHFIGDQTDPRTSWAEGFANFFAAATLKNPDAVDTFGTNGAKVGVYSFKQDTPPWKPGYWSEQSVTAALWHLFTDSPDGGTSLGLGFKPIWITFTGSLKNEHHIHLLDFADNLVRDNISSASVGEGVAKVLGERTISYTPGNSPAAANPWKQPIASGTAVTGSVDSRTPASRPNRWNLLTAAAFYTFTLAANGSVSIQLQTTAGSNTAAADLDLFLYNSKGELVGSSTTTGGVGSTEQITASVPAGAYLIEVRSWYEDEVFGTYFYNSGSYQLTATY